MAISEFRKRLYYYDEMYIFWIYIGSSRFRNMPKGRKAGNFALLSIWHWQSFGKLFFITAPMSAMEKRVWAQMYGKYWQMHYLFTFHIFEVFGVADIKIWKHIGIEEGDGTMENKHE